MISKSKVVLAIDPGAVSGAYAARDHAGEYVVGDLASVDGNLDAAEFSRLLDLWMPDVAIVEKVGAMPKQGVSSTFKFGKAVGIIEGVLFSKGVPTVYVTPQRWKAVFSLTADKEKSRALAIQRHPTLKGLSRVKDHGRAEALLMIDWYLGLHNQPTLKELFPDGTV